MQYVEVEALRRRVEELERDKETLQRANEELRERTRDLTAVVMNTRAPVYLKDADLRYLFVNPRYEELAHVTLGALRGLTDYDIFPTAVAELFRQQDREVIEARHPQEFEETIPLPDGEFTFITLKFPVVDADGALRAVGGFCTDITTRKKADAEREALVAELQSALEEVATLRGILPICSSCKQIRDDKGYWSQIESYLRSHSAIEFTHSLCPSCEQRLFGQEQWFKDMKR